MPIDFPNSPTTNQTFSSGGVTWRYDGTKWGVDAVSGPSYVTSLPASPVDGQEVYYAADATNGVIWHLRYRSGSSSSYKWEYVGGSPLYAQDNDGRSVTNQTTFADVPTDTLVVTMPLAGEYEVTHGVLWVIAAGSRFGVTGLAITNASNVVQTEATDDQGVATEGPGATGITGNVAANSAATNIFTITTAGWKLRERMRSGGNYQVTLYRRRIFVRPIRVG